MNIRYVTFTCGGNNKSKSKSNYVCDINLTKKLDAMLKLEDV